MNFDKIKIIFQDLIDFKVSKIRKKIFKKFGTQQ